MTIIKKPSAVDSPYVDNTPAAPARLASAPQAGGGVNTVSANNTPAVAAATNADTTGTGSNVSYYTSGIEGVAGLANYGRVFAGANVYVTLENQTYTTYNQNYTGSGTVGGANGEIQYNSDGLFAGSANLTFDGANIAVAGIKTDHYYYANGAAFVSGGTPGGSNTQVQFNNGGNFAGSSAFTFNRASNVLAVAGNITAGNVLVGNLETATNMNAKTGTFYGDVYSDGALYVGNSSGTLLGSDVVIQVTANAAGYSQTNFQNINPGVTASSDYILTADNGNNVTHFLDMGITSSGWDGSEVNVLANLVANNGYLYVQDGNLTIGTRAGNTSYGWNFNTTGVLNVPLTSSGGSTQIKYGMGNLVAYKDGPWTLGEYNGTDFGTEGISINPGIEGTTGLYLPGSDVANTQSVQLYQFGGGNLELIVSGNAWTFDNHTAINLPGNGTVRGAYVNSVANNFVQMQWTTANGVANVNPNNTPEPSNWVYVEQGGAYIETNVNTGNGSSRLWNFDNSGYLNFPTGSKIGPYGMGWTGFTTDGNTQGALSLAVLSSNVDYQGQSLAGIDITSGNPDDTQGFVSIFTGGPVIGVNQWQFAENGTLKLPGGSTNATAILGTDSNYGVTIGFDQGDLDAGKYLRVRGGGDFYSHIHLDTGNSAAYNLFLGDDNKYVLLGNTGNVVIQSNDNTGNSGTWTFDTTGNLTAPGAITTTGNSGDITMSNGNITGANNIVLANNITTTGTGGDITMTGGNIANVHYIARANAYTTLISYGTGGDGGPEMDWSNADSITNSFGNSAVYRNTLYINDQGFYVGINANGNVDIPQGSMVFGSDANLKLTTPHGNIVIGDVGASTGPAINSTSNFEIKVDSGNTNIGWTFNTAGNLLAPGNISAAGNVTANAYVGSQANVDVVAGSYSWIFDNTGNVSFQGGTGNIELAANTASLLFDTTGNITLNNSSTIFATNATSGGAGKTISIVAGAADQTGYYTTAGGNINITGGLGATDDGGGGGPGGSINITSGNSADPAGHAGNINITAGSKNWTFAYNGNFTTSGNINANAITLKNSDDFNQILFSDNGGGNDNGHIKVDGGTNMVISSGSNFYVKRAGSDRIAVTDTNSDFMATANVTIQANKAGSAQTWTFVNSGSMTVPVRVYANLTAVAGGRAFISDGNLVAAGNFGQQVSGGGSNTVPVWSNGTNWYIG